MTTKIENIKTGLFTSKEHYLAFRQSWKDHINNKKGKLTSAQHLLFCVLAEKDLSKSFSASTNESKHGFMDAYSPHYPYGLLHYADKASRVAKYDTGELTKPSHFTPDGFKDKMERDRNEVLQYLEPFGNGVTIEMFSRLYTDYLIGASLTNVVENQKKAA